MKKASSKHAVPATWKTRGSTAVLDTTAMVLNRTLTGRLIPVDLFLAFRGTSDERPHDNFAYGKKGEIIGNCLRCYGVKIIAPPEGSKEKPTEVIAPFLDAHIREGDLIWLAKSKDLYLQALNAPWPMNVLVKSFPDIGTWYRMEAGVIKPAEAPSSSLVSRERIHTSHRMGLVARAPERVSQNLGTMKETRAAIYYKSPSFK